jgi:hypothetical protein
MVQIYLHWITGILDFCHCSAAANSEDSTQFNFSTPKLVFRQAGASKLDSSLDSTTASQSQSHIATDGQSVNLS